MHSTSTRISAAGLLLAVAMTLAAVVHGPASDAAPRSDGPIVSQR